MTAHAETGFRLYTLRSWWASVGPQRLALVAVGVLSVIAQAPLALVPYFMGRLVAEATADPMEPGQVIGAAWWTVGMGMIHVPLWLAMELAYRHWVVSATARYEGHLFRHVIGAPYEYFVSRASGKIAASVTMCADRVRMVGDRIYFGYLGFLVQITGAVAVMLTANWQSAVIYAVGVAAMVVVGQKMVGRVIVTRAQEQDVRAVKNGAIIDSITGFTAVKSFGAQSREARAVDDRIDDAVKATQQAFMAGMYFWHAMGLMVRGVIWPALVGVNVWLLLTDRIDVGQTVTAIAAGLIFTESVWEMIGILVEFIAMNAEMDEAHLDLVGAELLQPQQGNELRRGSGVQGGWVSGGQGVGVVVDGVWFAYPDKPDEVVLRDVSLSVGVGEKVGLVGFSGSGKSTLVKLLLGFYEPARGVVGAQVGAQRVPLSSLVSYVPQDPVMFNRTVGENIAYAVDGVVSKDQMRQAAQVAHAQGFIERLAQGFDTMVGDRGVKLSGGQRQRVAIARAVLSQKPVLVLDEATSALDSESEGFVQEALEGAWQGRTVIAIAHRLSTLQSMDRIVVMDAGQVIEEGSHEELVNAGGVYERLWLKQSGGFLKGR